MCAIDVALSAVLNNRVKCKLAFVFIKDHDISLKKSIEVHFEDTSIVILRQILRQSMRKKFGRSSAYSCRTNALIEFHHFMKKD